MVWLSNLSAPFPQLLPLRAHISIRDDSREGEDGSPQISCSPALPCDDRSTTRHEGCPDTPLIYTPAGKMKIRLVGVPADKSQPYHPSSSEVTPFLPEIGKGQGDIEWARIFMGINGRIKGKKTWGMIKKTTLGILLVRNKWR